MRTQSDRAPVLWGPLTRFALAVALVAAAIDQAAKLWLLFVFDLGARGIVTLTPFLDLVLTWNTGISYGLFRQEGPLGQWALLALFKAHRAQPGPHHWRSHRQRHRPPCLRGSRRFRAVSRHDGEFQLQMVRFQLG
jgi:hypothetical protein